MAPVDTCAQKSKHELQPISDTTQTAVDLRHPFGIFCLETTMLSSEGFGIDLFRLGGLFSHYRPHDILHRIVLLSI